MNAIEIVLLIFGFLSISVSFFVGNRKSVSSENEEIESGSRDLWTAKEEELVKERIQTILQEESDEIVEQTKDILNRKSNEKIIEFDEFSGQVLEKITHNHEEFVFMYSMLSEKEKTLKENVVKEVVGKKSVDERGISQKEKEDKTVTTVKKKQSAKKVPSEPEGKVSQPALAESKKGSGGAHDQIIQMYKSGKSVLEISKELNIGQGEVKLMIALYGGKA